MSSEKLHKALVDAAKYLKDEFDAKDVGHCRLRITLSGRVHGEFKIEYDLCEQYDDSVIGADLDTVMEEYFRRRGWNKRNAPLALSGPKLEVVEAIED